VAERLEAAALTRPRLYIGLPDRFIEHGSREQCLTEAGLDTPAVIASIERWWLPQARTLNSTRAATRMAGGAHSGPS
jgi:1-deoxy-D-xylulose-5-phosphate synthase